MAHSNDGDTSVTPAKPSPIAPLIRPIRAFLAAEASGGIVLLIAAMAALVWANSPWAEGYSHFWHASLEFAFDRRVFSMSLEHWVNDGLMVVFFLLVGLEIKRELLTGELSSARKAALPIAAAVGGMIVPAAIFVAINMRGDGVRGWGVPMATDIAFAVGVLALVGRGLPTSLKVFLLAIAIVDDLGAILVIALFYTGSVSLPALGIAASFLFALVALNALRIRRPSVYLFFGFGLWLATLASGIHATVAGVLLAFTIPATGGARSPLARIEHALLRPVNFLIVPLFALANAGVDLRGGMSDTVGDPVAWGILFGLWIGKPLGVLGFSWMAVKAGVAAWPAKATPRAIAGVAVLCGIGFTMSLFVANLAFPNNPSHLAAAKVGILAASVLAGVSGALLLWSSGSRHSERPVIAKVD